MLVAGLGWLSSLSFFRKTPFNEQYEQTAWDKSVCAGVRNDVLHLVILHDKVYRFEGSRC